MFLKYVIESAALDKQIADAEKEFKRAKFEMDNIDPREMTATLFAQIEDEYNTAKEKLAKLKKRQKSGGVLKEQEDDVMDMVALNNHIKQIRRDLAVAKKNGNKHGMRELEGALDDALEQRVQLKQSKMGKLNEDVTDQYLRQVNRATRALQLIQRGLEDHFDTQVSQPDTTRHVNDMQFIADKLEQIAHLITRA